MKRFIVILLALALVCGCTVPASAAKQVLEPKQWDQLFQGWYYVPSTLPDWLSADTVGFGATRDYKGESREPDSWEVTLVSGDEWLDGAVVLKERTFSNGNSRIEIQIDNSVLTRPGRAVFKIHAEYPDAIYESERELWVLSWDEYPLVEWLDEPSEYAASVGDTVSSADLIACAAVTHKAEIAKALNAQAGREVFYTWGEGFTFPYSLEMQDGTIEVMIIGDDSDNIARYTFRSGGSYEIPMGVGYTNVESDMKYITVNVLPYYLTGPAGVKPGETAVFAVTDTDEAAGRTFALSLEGEGLSFNAETGELSVPADAALGTPYTVTAVPSDGGTTTSVRGVVDTGVLCGAEIGTLGLQDGFTVPLPNLGESGRDWFTGQYYSQTPEGTDPYRIVYDVELIGNDEYVEDPEKAVSNYDDYVAGTLKNLEVFESRDIDIDGHPARILVGRTGSNSTGYLIYARSNQGMVARLFTIPKDGASPDDLEKVTMADMEKLAAALVYDASAAQILPEDGALTLTAKDGAPALTAGKTLPLIASFASPEKLQLLNRKYKPDEIIWTIADAETGDAPEGITIDAKGVLKADKSVAEVKKITVTASSPVFMTSASTEITVIPAVKAISAEPAELFFYVGTDAPQTVKVVLDPDTVPPVGLTWKAQKEGVAEVTPGEGGTAVLKPLAAGKTTLTVSEPGGKKAQVKVNVVEPVTGLELAVSGKAKPGSAVTVKETLQPKTAGNKDVEWTLDVGEDIATVTKGKVKIAKDAPAGTVITVTCTATGAPEPVVATVQITVE